MANNTRIVTIGGGTGSFTLLSGLKKYTKNITAIVTMADDGGSTGILRDELGVLPPGDVRQCLAALSESGSGLRELLSYRFPNGSLKGHSFGNLLLTALEKQTGSFSSAVTVASKVLNVTGKVVPVTLTNTHLTLTTEDGISISGENQINSLKFSLRSRPKLELKPKAKLNPDALDAIMLADAVVVAPGNLYASLAPSLLATKMDKVFLSTKAKKIYVANLVTKPGQTDGFKVNDFASEIERFMGAKLDYVVYQNVTPPEDLLTKYAQEGEHWVAFDIDELNKAHYKAIGADLIAQSIHKKDPNDTLLERTLLRHDSEKVAKCILEIAQ